MIGPRERGAARWFKFTRESIGWLDCEEVEEEAAWECSPTSVEVDPVNDLPAANRSEPILCGPMVLQDKEVDGAACELLEGNSGDLDAIPAPITGCFGIKVSLELGLLVSIVFL